MKNMQYGFTLIELLIVIAIIGILGTALIPFLIGVQKRAYDTGAQSCAKSLQTVQGISFIDNKIYMRIGSGAGYLNASVDGVDSACKISQMYFNDRSNLATMASSYVIDVWDKRGSKVITITEGSLGANAGGATAFSSTGAGGSNLP